MPSISTNMGISLFHDEFVDSCVFDSLVSKRENRLEPDFGEEAWTPEYSKSRRYHPQISDLIYSTPKVMFKSKSKEIQRRASNSKQELFKEICSFKSLKNNWDGYGAVSLEIESAANAIYVISCLSNFVSESIENIFPNPNGTISIIWNNFNDETVSLEIGNKTMSFYVETANQETEFFDKIEINETQISKLAKCISKII